MDAVDVALDGFVDVLDGIEPVVVEPACAGILLESESNRLS